MYSSAGELYTDVIRRTRTCTRNKKPDAQTRSSRRTHAQAVCTYADERDISTSSYRYSGVVTELVYSVIGHSTSYEVLCTPFFKCTSACTCACAWWRVACRAFFLSDNRYSCTGRGYLLAADPQASALFNDTDKLVRAFAVRPWRQVWVSFHLPQPTSLGFLRTAPFSSSDQGS